MEFSHKPVLLTEAIDALEIKLGGIYVDGRAAAATPLKSRPGSRQADG